MNALPRWQFAATFDEARERRLREPATFGAVADLVASSLTCIALHVCHGRDESLRSCVQPVFDLTVSALAFDSFFNSPAGYRAQHLFNPTEGLAANLILIDLLLERLIGHAQAVRVAELEAIDVRSSLKAASCKAWVHEDDFPFESLTVDLAIDSWLAAAAAGEQKAKWGLCAPANCRLQIKGALLDPAGNEVVPRTKILRRYEIQSYGFT